MTTLFRPQDIFDLEKNMLLDLQDFQKKAATYRRCAGSSTNRKNYVWKGPNPCSAADNLVDGASLTTAKEKLTNVNGTGSLDKLNAALTAYKNANTGGIRVNENDTYNNDYSLIFNRYTEIGNIRQKLEANLSELYEIGDTRSNFYQRKLMSDSYTKILLTILATTLTIAAFASMQSK
jgi:hypothetical protein